MRKLTTLAMAAAALLVLGAGQASATSSINLIYAGGATGGLTAPGTVHTNASDTLTFILTMTVDSAGMAAYNFDLRWDQDGEDELNLVSMRTRSQLAFTGVSNPSPPPLTTTVGYLVNPPSAVEAGGSGSIDTFTAAGASPVPPFITSVSFRLGVVKFHVNGASTDGADIQFGFFTGFAGGNVFGRADLSLVTPNFGSFAIDSVPEAGTSLLMGLGVLGLLVAGRASRKS